MTLLPSLKLTTKRQHLPSMFAAYSSVAMKYGPQNLSADSRGTEVDAHP